LGGGRSILFGRASDTITAGAGPADIILSGGSETFVDSAHAYPDTLTGFSQVGGDRIHLTTDTPSNAVANSALVNGGQDKLITFRIIRQSFSRGSPNFDK
jgi:hypothetical protein